MPMRARCAPRSAIPPSLPHGGGKEPIGFGVAAWGVYAVLTMAALRPTATAPRAWRGFVPAWLGCALLLLAPRAAAQEQQPPVDPAAHAVETVETGEPAARPGQELQPAVAVPAESPETEQPAAHTGMLPPLGGHAVLLLLVQIALLLIVARIGAEISKRFGLPAVVGELAAGIALGPSLLGHFAPGAFEALFPHDAAQFHLLEAVGTIGMVLLLLLTGLETDLRLLRNLGRAALIASAMGMVLPFASGFALGMFMPDAYLANADRRTLYSFFLATAMAISAMPVIAKILMDLDLTKRNIGVVILSAGVVDDTAGWLILSLIAGAASSGEVRVAGLVNTLLLTAAFLALMAFVVYPLAKWLTAQATRRARTSDSDMVVVLTITFLCAAATEWIGVHAVFGAFVCGTLFKQVPQLEAGTVHGLETFVHSVLAPIFFGIVGLKVDLWTLDGGGMLALVLAVACLGKLVGCTLGSVWGGLRFWEGLSIAVAMNARGAMELVVASIGLSLGILNQEMYSIIVVVAVATSFLAPIGLRLTIRKVEMSEEEKLRIAAEDARGVLDPERARVLLATSGGPNALGSAQLARGLAARSQNPVQVIHIRRRSSWSERLLSVVTLGHRRRNGAESERILEQLRGSGLAASFSAREDADPVAAVLEETRKGYDFLVLGASMRGASLGGRVLEQIVGEAPCHLAILKTAYGAEPFQRVVVPFDGGVFARIAVEVAVRFCEAQDARLTLAVSSERRPNVPPVPPAERGVARPADEAELERISKVFLSTRFRPEILQLQDDPESDALLAELTSGRHDLVVIGAENRAVMHRLFFGYANERIIDQRMVSVAIVVPNVSRLR